MATLRHNSNWRSSRRREGEIHEDFVAYERADQKAIRRQKTIMSRMGQDYTDLRKASTRLHEAEADALVPRADASTKRRQDSIDAAYRLARKQYAKSRAVRAEWVEELEAISVDERLATDPSERETYVPLVRLRHELEQRGSAAAELRHAVVKKQRHERQAREAAENKQRELEIATVLTKQVKAKAAKRMEDARVPPKHAAVVRAARQQHVGETHLQVEQRQLMALDQGSSFAQHSQGSGPLSPAEEAGTGSGVGAGAEEGAQLRRRPLTDAEFLEGERVEQASFKHGSCNGGGAPFGQGAEGGSSFKEADASFGPKRGAKVTIRPPLVEAATRSPANTIRPDDQADAKAQLRSAFGRRRGGVSAAGRSAGALFFKPRADIVDHLAAAAHEREATKAAAQKQKVSAVVDALLGVSHEQSLLARTHGRARRERGATRDDMGQKTAAQQRRHCRGAMGELVVAPVEEADAAPAPRSQQGVVRAAKDLDWMSGVKQSTRHSVTTVLRMHSGVGAPSASHTSKGGGVAGRGKRVAPATVPRTKRREKQLPLPGRRRKARLGPIKVSGEVRGSILDAISTLWLAVMPGRDKPPKPPVPDDPRRSVCLGLGGKQCGGEAAAAFALAKGRDRAVLARGRPLGTDRE